MTRVQLRQDTAVEVLDTLLDLMEFLLPGAEQQLAELSGPERAGYRIALGNMMAQFPQELVARVIELRDDWPQRGMVEALCVKCDETFNPAGPDDLIHAFTQAGEECGGFGLIAGSWI